MHSRLRALLPLPFALLLASCGGGGGGGTTPVPTKAKWTVLVYMNAANNLAPDSVLNMNQMERVAQNPNVKMVVQWKQSPAADNRSTFDDTRRYLVTPDTTSGINSQLVQSMGKGVDMGSPTTLANFIQWGKTNYPADRYVLVLWDHGNGWRRKMKDPVGRAFSYDDETHHAIQIWQLPAAIGTDPFDIIAWDSSLMQMAEVAYELKDNTGFVVGGEESPPEQGYPYDTVFARFRDNPDASTKDLTKSFVDSMLSVPAYSTSKITQSVIDTTKLPTLSQAVDQLANTLIVNSGTVAAGVIAARNTTQSYSETSVPPRHYRDIADLMEKLKTNINVPAVQDAAIAVQNANAAAVVWEGHNSHSPGSHGLSIDFSDSQSFIGSATDYSQMKWGKSNRWGDFLALAP